LPSHDARFECRLMIAIAAFPWNELCMANSKIREHFCACRDLATIVRCAIWPFYFCICWRR